MSEDRPEPALSEDQLQPQDTLDDSGVDDVLDAGASPPDQPHGVDDKAVTARGELEGETIDERISQEEPEVWEDDGRSGDRPGASAEEAAMHTDEE